MTRKIILYAVLLTVFLSQSQAIELLLSENIQFRIDLELKEILDYSLNQNDLTLQPPELEIGLESSMDALAMKVAFDLSQLTVGDYEEIIRTSYLKYTLPADLSLKAGQFKVPFGYELQLSKKDRPYQSHSLSSAQLTPGYDRGISLAGKNLFGILDFEAGLFSGRGIKQGHNLLKNLLAAGSTTADLKLGEVVDLQLGYSGLVEIDFSPFLKYKLAQGIAALFSFNFGKQNDLKLGCEFLERFKATTALNSGPAWAHGVFAFAAYRIGLFEPYATYEHFKADTKQATSDDTMLISGGINFYPFDSLAMRLDYQWDYGYQAKTSQHEISLSIRYRI